MKKILGLLLSIVLLMTLVAGCKSSTQEQVSNNDDSSVKTDAEKKGSEKEEEEEIVINILSGTITEEVEGQLEQAMADAYMELHPNVKINYIGVPSNELSKRMTAYISSGDIPDAFSLLPDFYPKAYELGILEDITSYLSEDYFNGFVQSAVDDASINGELVRFPWFAVPSAVIYRTDWLEETGLPIPKNWDDFLEVAKAMTKDTDGDGVIDRWGFSMVGTNNGSGTSRFMTMARNFGCEDATYDGEKWTTAITTDQFRDALKFFTELHTVHGVVPPGPTETGYTEAVNYLATEKTGMMVTGSNGMGLVLTKNPDLKGKLGSFPVPVGESSVGGSVGLIGYSVNANSKHKEVVIDYLKFMVQPEYAIEFCEKTGRLPVRIESTTADVFNEPTYKGFIQALDTPYVVEKYPNYQPMIDAIGQAYTDIMANNVPFEEAMNKLLEKNQELLDEVNEE